MIFGMMQFSEIFKCGLEEVLLCTKRCRLLRIVTIYRTIYIQIHTNIHHIVQLHWRSSAALYKYNDMRTAAHQSYCVTATNTQFNTTHTSTSVHPFSVTAGSGYLLDRNHSIDSLILHSSIALYVFYEVFAEKKVLILFEQVFFI